MFTGRYSHSVAMTFPLMGKSPIGMDTKIPLLPEILKQKHGYKTSLIGKWHLGHAKKSYSPVNRGFDEFFGLNGAAFDHFKKTSSGLDGECIDLHRGLKQLKEKDVNITEHSTDTFMVEAEKQVNSYHLTATPETPLFLTVSLPAIHDPLSAYISDYAAGTECGGLSAFRRRITCGMIKHVERRMEQFVDSLKSKNMWDNSIFVLTSDNGGNPYVGGFNYPFKSVKSTAFEGGIRSPAFIKLPGQKTLGERFDGISGIWDFMPTLLAVVDGDNEKNELNSNNSSEDRTIENKKSDPKNYDGINLAPYLTKIRPSSEIANRGMFMNYDIFMNVSIYRKGDYKLILGSPGPPVIFEEPTSSVFHNVNYPHLFGFILKDNIMEYLTDLYTTYINPSPPFALIFLGY